MWTVAGTKISSKTWVFGASIKFMYVTRPTAANKHQFEHLLCVCVRGVDCNYITLI
jgi:hypothetical protein